MGKDLRGKELGVGIRQEKNGLYSGRFVDRNGKRRHRRFKKLQECRQWMADATYLNEHGNILNGSDILVSAWFENWIDIKRKSVRPNTVKIYTERYHHNIEPVIGDILLSEVKPIHCQKIFTQMAEEGYRTTSLNQTRIALYNMLEFARENDAILVNPCKKSVKSNIGKSSPKKEALTREIQKKFLEQAAGQSYEYQYRFILQTGLRTGELTGLKWDDIDFEGRTIHVRRTMGWWYQTQEWKEGPPKSKTGYRAVPLTDEAIYILRKQKEKNRRLKVCPIQWKDFVFLCQQGTPVKNTTYDTALFSICDKAGIPRFSMHILRHTFATRCIEGGMKPKTLQMILGHSNISITMDLYVHTTDTEKQKEIGMVADALQVI